MGEFYSFGKNLRGLLKGLLALEDEETTGTVTRAEEQRAPRQRFEDKFFLDEINRFVGSGGEVLLKGSGGGGARATQMEVGDRLIGIGITHLIESLSRTPGPDSFRAVNGTSERKIAARGFEVRTKRQLESGFEFTFGALSPREYSETIEEVSRGTVRVPAETIPEGTMILSFLLPKPGYTLKSLPGSPGANWATLDDGTRHWNVGLGDSDDFWEASFPSDDIGLLTQLPSSTRVGSIRFGLSLLQGSKGMKNFRRVGASEASGKTTSHHFSLSGYATGTSGLDTPFPIGLRTEIVFHPVSNSRRA